MSSKLFSSLFNMATDSGVAPAEKDKALRAVRKMCDERNRLPGDFISFDAAAEDDFDLHVVDPRHSLDGPNRQVAHLEAQLDEEQRTTTYLRRVLEDAEKTARSNAARLQADFDSLRQTMMSEIANRDARIVERDVRITDLEAQLAEQKVPNDARFCEETIAASNAPKTSAPKQNDAPGVIADQLEPSRVDLKTWKRIQWKAFERLAAAGLTKLKMARELTRVLGRSVTAAYVGELMRLRWSPSSGRRFAMWSAA